MESLNERNEQLQKEDEELTNHNEQLTNETRVLNEKNEQLNTQLTVLQEEMNNLNFQLSSIAMQRSTTADVCHQTIDYLSSSLLRWSRKSKSMNVILVNIKSILLRKILRLINYRRNTTNKVKN